MTNRLLECPKCGWVHFGVTKEYMDKWEADWQKYWLTLDEESRDDFGCKDAPPKAEDEYCECFCCGSKDIDKFFVTKKTLNGNTIQPIWDVNHG